MATLPLVQIDAFTKQPYGGNPCAVILDAEALSDAAMQAVAREMNLSETAFVLPPDSLTADVRARFFTPSSEIPMAGHPTIATISALLQSGRLELPQSTTTVRLELPAGIIPVEVKAEDGDAAPLITMEQLPPEFLATHDPAPVMRAFGLSRDDLLPDAPIATVSTGTPQLMVPLRSLDALQRAWPETSRFAEIAKHGHYFSAHLFVVQGASESGTTFARHFVPPPLPFEDLFTGSATGAMAGYLWRYGLIETPQFVAEQGHWMDRPGEAFVEVVGAPDAIETVKVGGYAAEVMRGELTVPQ